MAYMSQENKARIQALLKEVMPKDYKWSLRVRHSMVLILTISKAPHDLVGIIRENGYTGEDEYAYIHGCDHSRYFKGHPELIDLFNKISRALGDGNHNNSDVMSDYFDVGWYTEINIGRYDKPFTHAK